MKMVIIDSGISFERPFRHITSTHGISIFQSDENSFSYSNDFIDEIGHGTAVANILDEHLAVDIDLFVIKIFGAAFKSSVELLMKALEYCYEHLKCNLIQISLGVLYSDNRLKNIIDKLALNGVLVVSSFENSGSISYPAAYENVLGIDVNNKYDRLDKYDIFETNIIDIQGANVFYRTYDLHGKRTIVRGSSFYCSYISALIINSKPDRFYKTNILDNLKRLSNSVYTEQRRQFEKIIEVENAIIFPFNKEIHSIAAFEHMLKFNVVGYFDVREKGTIHRCIKDILPYTDNESIIRDFNRIDWEGNFDTMICGHTHQLSRLLETDLLEKIFEKCALYEKQLICFDYILDYIRRYPTVRAFCPYVTNNVVPSYRFGKLRSPNIPIVGVFGTSSRQGKMTLQLKLREAFLKRNIKVHNLGSEPESALFSFEGVYAFGYGSLNTLNPMEVVTYVNELVYRSEFNECEILIVGSQSGTVPNQLKNLCMIPLEQYCFLLGSQPDSIILCVNAHDTVEYIERTMSFFKSVVNANVICMVVSDLNKASPDLKRNSCEYFKAAFGIPCFDLKAIEVDYVIDIIMKYYEGEQF